MDHKNKTTFTIIIIALNVLLFFCVSRWWLIATIPITLMYFLLRSDFERFYNLFFGIVAANLAVILLPFPFWVWLIVFAVGVLTVLYLSLGGGNYAEEEYKKKCQNAISEASNTFLWGRNNSFIPTSQSTQQRPSQTAQQRPSRSGYSQSNTYQQVQPTYSNRPANANGMYRNYNQPYPNNVQGSNANSNSNDFLEKMKNKALEKLEDKVKEKSEELVDKFFDDDEDKNIDSGHQDYASTRKPISRSNSYQGNYRQNRQSAAYNQQQGYENQGYDNQNYGNQGYGYQAPSNVGNANYYTPPSNTSYDGGYDDGGDYDDYDDV